MESIKSGKSSGLSGRSVEIIKYGGDRMRKRIRNLIDRMICCSKMPKEWKTTHISSIFKIGDRINSKKLRE